MEVWLVFIRWLFERDADSTETLALYHTCSLFRSTLSFLGIDIFKVRLMVGIDMYLQGTLSSEEYWLPFVRVIESCDTPTLIEIDSYRYLRWSLHHHILLEL